MPKELIIQACKCTLVLTETELFNGLSPDVLTQALRRGKGYKRALASEQRQHHVDGEQLQGWLSGEKIPDNADSLIESMPVTELRRGCAEYLRGLLQVKK